jgi:molybdate transport system regulatory protein
LNDPAREGGAGAREESALSTRLTIRFDFDSGRRLGAGKIALLEAIDKTGSISAAGRAHAMSYRRAWLLVDDLNQLFNEPLVLARQGGQRGGGAKLTERGKRIVALYRGAEAKMRAAAAREIEDIEAALASETETAKAREPDPGLTASSRRGRTA